MSDMTNTRLVWKTKEIRRTAASLAAYAIIGIATALIGWGLLAAVVGAAQELTR